MITFENGALTTDATLTVADTQAVFQFANHCVQTERSRIIKLLMEDDYFHFIIAGQKEHPVGCQMCQLIALIKEKK